MNLSALTYEEGPEPVVYVRAVGIKERNQVRIGKEVFEL
jgi:hypothetical protein